MRWPFVLLAIGCTPPPTGAPGYRAGFMPPPRASATYDPVHAGVVVDRKTEFAFAGGRIELETRRDGDRVVELARNRYAVPIMMAWELDQLANLTPMTAPAGVSYLPAASTPDGEGPPVVLATLAIGDLAGPVDLSLAFHARFGDPRARPRPYAYRLPYRAGQTYSVLQGFHGAFSHRGSNEYAVDFDCPVATHVLAARPGIVVASNAAAQGAGTTPAFLEYRNVNFILVLHDDGTLGEYMHLAPSGIEIEPGQRVARGDELALSGNTGFSSTPHLHFQVMTAGDDGVTARSFPIEFAVAPGRVEEPIQGRAYPGWE